MAHNVFVSPNRVAVERGAALPRAGGTGVSRRSHPWVQGVHRLPYELLDCAEQDLQSSPNHECRLTSRRFLNLAVGMWGFGWVEAKLGRRKRSARSRERPVIRA